ncbi:site-specific DNA-methyltransferase [Rhodoferax sp.]|uniref:site-specific DNA-methyltransferase n=2 Tax=Rhodoferax sp. TaxID=50421 RepID=UPI0027336E2F|nr:site-specific DNA-methyltransferase [Rhodoferax sp.]MDP3193195.1 site-specific DNA-methyltransferase [Rhodoferax sp.]MDP3865245.1 site-specific DNA-methyltransferase [Rhodoferax sp.]
MSKYDDLVRKLKEIFQIDRPELDFGVYRILNARVGEINDYLENGLKAKIAESLAASGSGNLESLQKELKEKEAQYRADGMDPDTVPKVKELRQKIADLGSGSAEHENAVFTHLLTFFSRYYDKGDFISQRRYKGDTYAIPYGGEEVVLHWANKDQYYTKSGENFSNYGFKLDDGRTVKFRLVAADTAKDNRKDNDKERHFVLIDRHTRTLLDESGEEYEQDFLPVEEVDGELVVRFDYKAMPKGSKQDALVSKAVEAILADPVVQARWLDLSRREPTEKNPQRTLLEKCLTSYTTKNSADYFIHKDLGGFLRRELDFYIKNEVMNLDDVQSAERFSNIEKSLRLIQTFRFIALDLVSFLAHLEEFQKKLWLKKKFVVSSSYCLTLDRVPDELYGKITENRNQWEQWERLGMLQERLSDLLNQGKMKSISYLKSNQFLMVDTLLYDNDFKCLLLNSIDDLDESIDGLLVHGDNFQALNLLGERYDSKVKCTYIDPPYNTGGDDFLYKDGFQHGSWLSLLYDRMDAGGRLMAENGILAVSLDGNEVDRLSSLVLPLLQLPLIQRIVWKKTDSPNEKDNAFSTYHEYISVYGRDGTKTNLNQLNKPEILESYPKKDDDGRLYRLRQARKNGASARREDRPSLFYELTAPDETKVLPMAPEGWEGRWVMKKETFDDLDKQGQIVWTKRDYGWVPYYKEYAPADPLTPYSSIWDDLDQNRQAKAEYTAIMGSIPFSNPKPTSLIGRVVNIACKKGDFVLDYFAGSGTTACSVINTNRISSLGLKYIVVEQSGYFDSVTKPRIQKTVFSTEWKDGKSIANGVGISHIFKVLKIEGYEDTLNNLNLTRTHAQQSLLNSMSVAAKEDYLLRYLLDIESRGSLLSVDQFKKPFDFKLKVAVDSAGAYEERTIDLVETFNYLIGLQVKHVDMQVDMGFVAVTGVLPSGEKALLLWRDVETLDYDKLNRLCEKLAINPADSEFDVVYVNGDHNIPAVFTSTEAEGGVTKTLKIRQIEPEFMSRMFNTEV